MKLFFYLRRSLSCCCFSSNTSTSTSKNTTSATTSTTVAAIKNRLSSTISDLFKDHQQETRQDTQEAEEEDCLIDAASTSHLPHPTSLPLLHATTSTAPSSATVVVTYLCVQRDQATLPPILFEFSMTTDLLAREMATGLVRIALEYHRNTPREHRPPYSSSSTSGPRRSLRAGPLWRTFCNGRKVGYAVKRSPNVKDLRILNTVRSMSGGAGVLPRMDEDVDVVAEEGELMYMRGSYERVMGSQDSVAYHLINLAGGSPAHELSVFLVRSG